MGEKKLAMAFRRKLKKALRKLKAMLHFHLILCFAQIQSSLLEDEGIMEDPSVSVTAVPASTSSYEYVDPDDVDNRSQIFIDAFRRQLSLERQISLQLRYYYRTYSSGSEDDRISPPPPPPPSIQ